MKNWVVYLLECSDGTYYCGATNCFKKRLEAHNAGKGAKYTRGRTPVHLKICQIGLTKSQALKLEHRVKQVPRAKKEQTLQSASWCSRCGKFE